MRILNLVKYDFYSIFKSPLTYLAILVVSSLIATQSILMANSMDNPKHIIVYGSVFAAAKWLLLIIGLMFVVKTITRDFSQGTIQLYMSKVKTRVGYIISKTISIILISILFAVIHYVILIVVQASSNGKNLAFSKYVDNLWFFLIFLLFFGLFLFLITLASQKTAMIFSLGVFLVLIVPFIKPFITFIKNNFEVGNFKFSQPQSLSYCKFIYFLIYLGWNYKLLSKMKRQFYSGLI